MVAIASIELYDLSGSTSSSWYMGASLSSGQRVGASLTYGNNLLFVGGDSHSGRTKDMWEYLSETGEWTLRSEKLGIGQRGPVAIMIPNSLISCPP